MLFGEMEEVNGFVQCALMPVEIWLHVCFANEPTGRKSARLINRSSKRYLCFVQVNLENCKTKQSLMLLIFPSVSLTLNIMFRRHKSIAQCLDIALPWKLWGIGLMPRICLGHEASVSRVLKRMDSSPYRCTWQRDCPTSPDSEKHEEIRDFVIQLRPNPSVPNF